MTEYPDVSRALRGWTRRRTIRIVTQAIVNGLAARTAVDRQVHIAIQPMPPREVSRKPEDQRDWGWWSIWIKARRAGLLDVDDVIVVSGKPYLISKIHDWAGGGYRSYEAHENWTGEIPEPEGIVLTFGGEPVTFEGEVVTYAGA